MLFTFADAAGGEVPGMIAEVGDEQVTVDFNLTLSGRTIQFKVRMRTLNRLNCTDGHRSRQSARFLCRSRSRH